MDVDAIIAGLSAAQREALVNARVVAQFVPGEPWPHGVTQFFNMGWDSLTPLGLAVRSALIERAAK